MSDDVLPGDFIRLVEMPDDPDPIPPGTEGQVTEVIRHSDEWSQIRVEWDNGRTLMLSVPPDRFEIVERWNPAAHMEGLLAGREAALRADIPERPAG